jgi:hypothetical protein
MATRTTPRGRHALAAATTKTDRRQHVPEEALAFKGIVSGFGGEALGW